MKSQELLVELIFKGIKQDIDFTFLRELITSAKEVRFNSPETSVSPHDTDAIINVLKNEEYIDLVVTTDQLNINGISVPRVFINIGIEYNDVDILLFFDIGDIKADSERTAMDSLKSWAMRFKNKYKFDSFLCQMDNGNENEYYFNDRGLGPLYSQLT